MKQILVGCEESQVVTRAFREAGFETWSCDLQPTRGNPYWHIQQDIMDVIPTRRWHRIILHPDCTCLAVCGNKWYGRGMPKHDERIAAIEWTLNLWNLSLEYADGVALENPQSVIFPVLRDHGADVQYVQPYQFGHLEQKKTGLALSGLYRLQETNNVYDEMMKLPKKDREKKHYMSPGPNRKRDRSITYPGIAQAMVKYWA